MRRKHVVFYGWVIVFVAFMVVFLGSSTRSAFSVFFKPMLTEFGWERGPASLAASLNTLLYGLMQPVMGKAVDRFGARRLIITSTIVMGLGTALMATTSDLWQLYFTFGVVASIGSGGLAFIITAVLVTNWFTSRRGLALGISQAGFPAAQVILIPLSMYLIITIGWRLSYVVIAALFIVVLLPITVLLLRSHPSDMGLQAYGEEEGSSATGARTGPGGRGAPEKRISLVHALKMASFWQLAFGFFVCGFTVSMVTTHLVPFATDIGIREMDAASALALMGLLNVGGTMLVGGLTDKIGMKNPLAVIYFTRGLAFLILLRTTNLEMLYFFAMVFGFAYLATVPPTSGLTAHLYGRPSMGVIFGTVSLSHQIGGAIGVYLAGWFFDNTGTYQGAYVLGAIACFAAAAASYAIKERRATMAQPRVAA